jgi:hypothetical protein
MYLTIRRYVIDPQDVEELTKRVRDVFVPVISAMPGFVSYHVIDAGRGILASVSVFETKEAASQSNEVAADWNREHLAKFVHGVPNTTSGPIIMQAP